jgi:hypothetical protein
MLLPSVMVVATGLLAGACAPAGVDRTNAAHASNGKADVRKEFMAPPGLANALAGRSESLERIMVSRNGCVSIGLLVC